MTPRLTNVLLIANLIFFSLLVLVFLPARFPLDLLRGTTSAWPLAPLCFFLGVGVTAGIISIATTHGELKASSPVRAAAINTSRATHAAILGFLLTTAIPLLVTVVHAAVTGEIPAVTDYLIAFSIGLVGGLVVFLMFLAPDIRGYIDYRFDQIVEQSAVWTDDQSFESALGLLRNSTRVRVRWILAKFISRKLSTDFRVIHPSTLQIKDMTATEYSDLLSVLVAEARTQVLMACPLPPKQWLEELFPQCSSVCTRRPAGSAPVTSNHMVDVDRKGLCVLAYDPAIVRFAEGAFEAPNATDAPKSNGATSCPLIDYGLPRHLQAVRLSQAEAGKVRAILPAPEDGESKGSVESESMHYYRAFAAIQNKIDAPGLKVRFNPRLREHSRELYRMITKAELDADEVLDYNVLDGIVVAWRPNRPIPLDVQSAPVAGAASADGEQVAESVEAAAPTAPSVPTPAEAQGSPASAAQTASAAAANGKETEETAEIGSLGAPSEATPGQQHKPGATPDAPAADSGSASANEEEVAESRETAALTPPSSSTPGPAQSSPPVEAQTADVDAASGDGGNGSAPKRE